MENKENLNEEYVSFEEVSSNLEDMETVMEVKPVEERVSDLSKQDVEEVVKVLNQPLTPVQQRKVESIKKQINLDDETFIRSYGADEQREINELSKRASDGVSTRNSEIVGPQITKVLGEIRKTRKKKKGFISKLLAPLQNKAEEIREATQTAEKGIQSVEKMIAAAEPQSKQNSALLKLIWDKNAERYEDLNLFLLAGEEVITEKRAALMLKKAEVTPENAMLAQKLGNEEHKVSLFDKRLHDLRIAKQLSVLTAVKVNMLEKANAESIENLRTVAQNILPIWRQEIAIDGIADEIKRNSDVAKAVSDTANEILISTAQKTHQLTTDIARQSERPIIDVETIHKVSEIHLNTIMETIEIKNEAEQRRIDERAELEMIEKDLTARILGTSDGKKFLTGKKRKKW